MSNLIRQIALDYARHHIHCNALCPGYTKTAIFAETSKNQESADSLNVKHPLKGCGTPEDIAQADVVLANEDASWITGIDFLVDGVYTVQ